MNNKELVRRFYEEVENQGKLDVVEELFAPDFRDVYNSGQPVPVQGFDAVKRLATTLHERMDMHVEIEDLVAEGDRVVARIACNVVHKSPFMGAEPTGRRFVMHGVEIFRVVGGKLAERWVFIDRLPMMRELGVLPQ